MARSKEDKLSSYKKGLEDCSIALGQASNKDTEAQKRVQSEIVKTAYELSKQYAEETNPGFKVKKVMKLGRHGLCTEKDKEHGLLPNTDVNPEAKKNMAGFDLSMIMYNKVDTPKIYCSPVRRAESTCEAAIQSLDQFSDLEVYIDDHLAEAIAGSSSIAMTEKKQYEELSKKSEVGFLAKGALLASRHIKKYGEEYFDTVKKGEQASVDHMKDVAQVYRNKSRDLAIPKNEKIRWFVENAMDLNSSADTIFFGHGKNTKETLSALFPNYAKALEPEKKLIGKQKIDELDYGETQDIMVLENEQTGEKKLFLVPLRLGISQYEQNKVTGRVTEFAEVTKAFHNPNELISQPSSTQKMASLFGSTASTSTTTPPTVTSTSTVTSTQPTSTSTVTSTQPTSISTVTSTQPTSISTVTSAPPTSTSTVISQKSTSSTTKWEKSSASYKDKPQDFKEKKQAHRKEEESSEDDTLTSGGLKQ